MAAAILDILPKNKITFRIYSLISLILPVVAYIYMPVEDLPNGLKTFVIVFLIILTVYFYGMSFWMDRNKEILKSDSHSDFQPK